MFDKLLVKKVKSYTVLVERYRYLLVDVGTFLILLTL